VPAAFCGGSGVLAAAVAGIYMGRNAPKFLPFTVRLQGQPAWVLLSFLLNSSLFFLTGLQFRPLLLRLADYPRESLILYGVMVTLAVILIRFIWVFPAAYLPRLFSKKTRENDPPPSWRLVFIVGWAGMRGAISLAAALSIPVFLSDYAAFPQRDMIIFLTFCVIFGTLVLQGLGLKPLVRLLNIHCHVSGEQRRDAAAQEAARRHSAAAALDNIKRWKHEKRFSPSVLKRLHDHYARGLESLDERRTDGDRDAALALITVEREALLELRRQGTLSDHQLREVERDLDVMESQVHRGRHLPF
jgi:CPA1 family monovalent cation:H+ antiporter